MYRKAVPMLHVPDVAATAAWYERLGFTIATTASDGDEVVWASLRCGSSELMLSGGGRASDAARREVDLYVTVDDLDATFARVAPLAELVEAVHDTFYGMREFIIRDCNRFWITFGQPLTGR